MINKTMFILLVCISCFAEDSLAQVPNLGSVSAFAAFTAAGAFGNTGLTKIDGDIGDNGAAITGFPPGTVNGTIHFVDGATSQAANDLTTAYNYLASVGCNTVEDVQLGNNQVITPGVYCVGSAATLSGVLTLDAQGNPNAVFIFQINGIFTTGEFSKVVVINSASDSNIYWQVNGAVSLGDSSAFTGSILANGAIDLLEGAAVVGRVLSISGAITLRNNAIAITSAGTPLPIELISFGGNCDRQNVILTWHTEREINNDYFSIEHSADAVQWLVAGTVKGAGNSNTPQKYYFTDTAPGNAMSYYRLKQTDLDGKAVYSTIITVANCQVASMALSVYPIPGNGILNLSFSGDKNKVESIAVYNASGLKVFNTSRYQSPIDLTRHPDGIYFLYFSSGSGMIIEKVVIRR